MRNARILTSLLRTTPAALLLGATLVAQNSPQTIPQGYLGANLANTGGNSWPFNNTNADFRTMFVYDGAQIKHAGPILINRIRFKIYNAAINFTPTTYNNTTISLSTCPAPQSHSTMSTTWASNIGKDVKVIFQGAFVSLQKSAATGLWFVDIKLPSSFLYDKSKGDLTFDFVRKGTIVKTSTTAQAYRNGASAVTHVGRVYGSAASVTGAKDTNGGIIELTYTPAKGLFSDFTAAPTTGPGPLKVQFTDKTFTSNGPITAWQWDFDGDNVIDSKVQNPSFTYPKKGFDATYDVSLTTWDGTNPFSKVTKKGFIIVDPSDASAVNFGKGSTNKPTGKPIIPIPAGPTAYNDSRGYPRGMVFQSPTTFVVTGFQVPNPGKHPMQTVAFYLLKAKPPVYSAQYVPTAADLKFFAKDQKADTVLVPKSPIVVAKDQWVAVLGVCHGAAQTVTSAYATGGYKSNVLKAPITLSRLISQNVLRANNGLGGIATEASATASMGEVEIYVAGQALQPAPLPSLTTIGLPKLGTTPKLSLRGNIFGAQGALLLMGVNRLPVPVPTPFGNLLITPPFAFSIFVAGGTGDIGLPIPSNNALKGIQLEWQGAIFNITNSTFGMTNGTEWYVGK